MRAQAPAQRAGQRLLLCCLHDVVCFARAVGKGDGRGCAIGHQQTERVSRVSSYHALLGAILWPTKRAVVAVWLVMRRGRDVVGASRRNYLRGSLGRDSNGICGLLLWLVSSVATLSQIGVASSPGALGAVVNR